MAPPALGHGIGLRRTHWDAVFEAPERVDFIEILTENFLGDAGRGRRILERAAATWPIVLHGTALSIGSVSPLDEQYLAGVAALIRTTGARWFSDHLCFSSAFGVEYHDLLPMPFTREALDHLVPRIERVKALADVPFALENPSYYIQYGASEMDEAAFLGELLERADCGLLLDVNNVYVNSRNHGFDPRAFIDALPLERVIQIHMAGHHDLGDVIIDTHGAPCIDPVLDLYAYTLRKTGPVATLLEWDNEIPALERVLAENDRIRAVAREALGVTLEGIQRAVHAAVKDGRPVEAVAAELGVRADRLAIYRRMIRSHVHTALVTRLPVATALLGAADDSGPWPALFEAYLAACPPSAPTLPEAAAAFPGFLGEAIQAGQVALPGYVAALAELEWALFQVNRDQTEIPDPIELSAPVLNPTLQLMAWPWAVGTYLAARQRGAEPAAPADHEELVLLFRRPATGNPVFHVATPERLFVLKLVHEAVPLPEAAALAGIDEAAATAALEAAIAIGLVLAPGG